MSSKSHRDATGMRTDKSLSVVAQRGSKEEQPQREGDERDVKEEKLHVQSALRSSFTGAGRCEGGWPWLELGGSGSLCILSAETEVGRAGWGHKQCWVLPGCGQSLTHACGSIQHTFLVPHLPVPQFPHLEEEGTGSQHF